VPSRGGSFVAVYKSHIWAVADKRVTQLSNHSAAAWRTWPDCYP